MDTRLHPRIEYTHRATGLRQGPSDLEFKLSSYLATTGAVFIRNPGKNITRQQSHGDPDRVVDDNGIIDTEPASAGGGHTASTARETSDGSIALSLCCPP